MNLKLAALDDRRLVDEVKRVNTETTPPNHIPSEEFVIGAGLRDPHIAAAIVWHIKEARHFYGATCRAVFEAWLSLAKRPNPPPIDVVTTDEALASVGYRHDDLRGPRAALVMLREDCVTKSHWRHYAETVLRMSAFRQLQAVLVEAVGNVANPFGPPEDLIADLTKQLDGIQATNDTEAPAALAGILPSVMESIGERLDHGCDPHAIRSGFYKLDELLGGFRAGQLVVVAGRPGSGKSSFALNVAEDAAESGKPVLIVSLEMSRAELAERLLSGAAGIPSQLLRNGSLGPQRVPELINAQERLSTLPLHIVDRPGNSIGAIAATCRRYAMSRNIRMVVVDYLQLIPTDQRGMNRAEAVGQISRALKLLAIELGVPVIALSQLNRASENREGHRPRMSDLRESGSIEQDADVVLLLHRDKPDDQQVEIILEKQRSGPTGSVFLDFDRKLTTFRDPSQFRVVAGDGMTADEL